MDELTYAELTQGREKESLSQPSILQSPSSTNKT